MKWSQQDHAFVVDGIVEHLVGLGVPQWFAVRLAPVVVREFGGRIDGQFKLFDGRSLEDVVKDIGNVPIRRIAGPPPTPPKTPGKRKLPDSPVMRPVRARYWLRSQPEQDLSPSDEETVSILANNMELDVVTPTASSRSLRFAKAQSASSGFLSTDVKWKKGGRPRKLSKFQNHGVLLTFEFGFQPFSLTSWSDSIIFGHCTFVRELYIRAAFMCLIKALFNKIDITIHNFREDTMNSNIGDTIRIRYKLDYDASTGVDTMFYNVPNPVPAYNDCVADFISQFYAITGLNSDFHLIDMSYQTNNNDAYRALIKLTNAKFKWNTKSAIKVQNRTQFEDAPESDDIKNVPVYGKSYEGYGTGSNSFRDQNVEQQFVCGGDNGLLFKQCSSAKGLTEAPPPGYFNQVKKVGKIHLDPGQVKTSVLSHHLKCRQEHFFGHLADNISASDPLIPFGEFRFFHVEHMLKTSSTDPQLNIVGEHNLRIAMSLSTEWSNVTDEYISNAYVQY